MEDASLDISQSKYSIKFPDFGALGTYDQNENQKENNFKNTSKESDQFQKTFKNSGAVLVRESDERTTIDNRFGNFNALEMDGTLSFVL
jgi:hypothetical protein